jgi:hypothetical protein
VVTACKKGHNSTPSCSTAPNTITISDNGNTYCIAGNGFRLPNPAVANDQNNVAAVCLPNDSISFLEFAGDGGAFSISYYNNYGPSGGLGVYRWPAGKGTYSIFPEKFPGGHTYTVTGGTATVTSADSQKVQATFSLDLADGSVTKTITGSLSTTKP